MGLFCCRHCHCFPLVAMCVLSHDFYFHFICSLNLYCCHHKLSPRPLSVTTNCLHVHCLSPQTVSTSTVFHHHSHLPIPPLNSLPNTVKVMFPSCSLPISQQLPSLPTALVPFIPHTQPTLFNTAPELIHLIWGSYTHTQRPHTDGIKTYNRYCIKQQDV